jgi:DNA-binding NtrC family response regulator
VVTSYFDGESPATGGEANASELSPLRLALGTRHGHAYDLLVTPKDSCECLISCGTLWRLISALLTPARRLGGSSADEARSETADAADDEFGVFRSPAMITMLETVKRIAPLNIMILLTGESGTGKEVVANVIHRGAFTGAVESFRSVIRAAEGGTLLLRFLDSKEIHPLGEATPQRVAVRIVAATNADLERNLSSRTAT